MKSEEGDVGMDGKLVKAIFFLVLISLQGQKMMKGGGYITLHYIIETVLSFLLPYIHF